MPSEKTKRAQCIIARYQKEIQIDDDRNEYYCSLYAPRKYGNEKLRKYYCFPMLYSALFYDPTPEQISYIAEQAEHLLWLKSPFLAEKLMQFASAETGNPDAVPHWKDGVPESKLYEKFRPLLVFGSAHPNGYVREKCLTYFSEKGMFRMIGYTLMRLNDWVPEVRRTARDTLNTLLQQERASEELIQEMPFVERLRRSERVHRDPAFSMEQLDSMLMQHFESNFKYVISAKANIRALCYKVFALHPEPKYRGLILQFYQNEWDGELRCMLERIYLQMSESQISEKTLKIFTQDKYERVRLIAYEYRMKHDGVWGGFEKLLLSPSRRIRIFARNQLTKNGFDYVQYCRSHLPESLCALGDFGTEEDIPRIRPYLDTHPIEAMSALVKRGAEDSKALLLRNMQSSDAKLSKSAYRLARVQKCMEPADLLPVIKNTTDQQLQYRLAILLTKDGIWPAMPYLLRFLRDYPKLRNDLYYLIWKKTREKAFVSEELAQEICSALAYARETNAIPVRLNNQICFQHRIM